MTMNPTTYAIPFFIISMMAEFWVVRRRIAAGKSGPGTGKGYVFADTRTSLLMGIGSVGAGILVGAAVLAIATWAYEFRIFDIGSDLPTYWWAWILCFIIDDFAYYIFHRSAHRVRWFWASHVNHHSSQFYNLSTALRQTWTGFLSMTFIFRMPLFFIGFPPEMVLIIGGFNLIYQFWIHSEAIDKMPRWFEYIFNTPSHHRVHHGTNAQYLDSNYAGVFIIWDRMLGSFVAEKDDDPVQYGLVHNLDSENIIIVAFHEWIAIARDMWAAPWRHKLSYLIREPGWSHDGSRMTSAMIKAQDIKIKKQPE
ncbi:C-5 sterol desaturase [Sphingorhabdus lutea]|uniref:C-5 sterol desaturase n=1 Tax=Sphingorhabdus lutea TaxID=1913578 RepID=A0A1L3JAB5_9SPHN|nr:sterol desaturase family protein [Sphingorhabdus lutea]APG62076.1 C-5 sterol desaturase [Sphingorhabdus lutea]